MYNDLEKQIKNAVKYIKKLDYETLLYIGNYIITELNKRDRIIKANERKK